MKTILLSVTALVCGLVLTSVYLNYRVDGLTKKLQTVEQSNRTLEEALKTSQDSLKTLQTQMQQDRLKLSLLHKNMERIQKEAKKTSTEVVKLKETSSEVQAYLDTPIPAELSSLLNATIPSSYRK